MRSIFLALLIIFSTTFAHAQTVPAPAAIDPAKKQLILKFIDVFGVRKSLEENLKLMVEQASQEDAKDLKDVQDKVKIDEIIDILVPIYDHNFSTDDLQAFITFYDSPHGRVLIEKIPNLMKESMDVTSQYLEKKFPEMKEK